MKRCLLSLLLLSASFLFSQSNFVTAVNQTASVASPTASQPDPQAQSRILNGYGVRPRTEKPSPSRKASQSWERQP